MRRHENGYTLGEMMAIVLVLSIAAVVTVPNLSSSDPEKIELAAQEFARAIRHARAEAIRTGAPRGFHGESTAKRVRVFTPDTAATPWTATYDVLHPLTRSAYDVAIDSHPFARADQLTAAAAFGGACVRPELVYFDALGIPRCIEPETVRLERLDLVFELGGQTRTVTLEGVTGRVTVQ